MLSDDSPSAKHRQALPGRGLLTAQNSSSCAVRRQIHTCRQHTVGRQRRSKGGQGQA